MNKIFIYLRSAKFAKIFNISIIIIQGILVGLKLLNIINFSWLLVLLPIILYSAIMFIIFAVIGFMIFNSFGGNKSIW